MEDAHKELQRLRATIQRMQEGAEVENFVRSAIAARGDVATEEQTAYSRILTSHNNLISGHLFEVEYAQKGARQAVEKEEAQDRAILQDCITNRIISWKAGGGLNSSIVSSSQNVLQQSYQSSIGSLAAFMPTPPDVPRQSVGPTMIGSQSSNYFSASPVPRPPAYQRVSACESPSASPTSSLGYRRSSAYSASIGIRSNIPSPVGVGHPLLPRAALSRMQRLQQDDNGSPTPQRQPSQPGGHGGVSAGLTIGEGRGLSSAMSMNDHVNASSPSPVYTRREEREKDKHEILGIRPLPPPFHLTHPLPGRSGSGSSGSTTAGHGIVNVEHREGRGGNGEEFHDDAEAAVAVLVPGVRFPLRGVMNSNVQSTQIMHNTITTTQHQQQQTPPRAPSVGYHPLLPRVASRAGRDTPSVYMDDEASTGDAIVPSVYQFASLPQTNASASFTRSTSGDVKRNQYTKNEAAPTEQREAGRRVELNEYDMYRPIDASAVLADESVARYQFVEEEERTRKAMNEEYTALRRRQRSVIAGALLRAECAEMMARTKIETEEELERRGGFKCSLAVVNARRSSVKTADQISQHVSHEVTLDDIPAPSHASIQPVVAPSRQEKVEKVSPTIPAKVEEKAKPQTPVKPEFDVAFSSTGVPITRVGSKRVTFEASIHENGNANNMTPKTTHTNAPLQSPTSALSRHSSLVVLNPQQQPATAAAVAMPSPPSTPSTPVSSALQSNPASPIIPLNAESSSVIRLPRRPSGGQVKVGSDAAMATVPQSGPEGEFLGLYPIHSPPPAHIDRVREIGGVRGGGGGGVGEQQGMGGKRVSNRSDPIHLNISEHLRHYVAPQTWA